MHAEFIGKLKELKSGFVTSDFSVEWLNLQASPCLHPSVLW